MFCVSYHLMVKEIKNKEGYCYFNSFWCYHHLGACLGVGSWKASKGGAKRPKSDGDRIVLYS